MTKLIIEPGVCGFTAEVTSQTNEDDEIVLTVTSGCKAIQNMMAQLGDTFDPYELCLCKPGTNPLYRYAEDHFPAHGGCTVIAGITKCAEAEAGLALKKNVSFTFV